MNAEARRLQTLSGCVSPRVVSALTHRSPRAPNISTIVCVTVKCIQCVGYLVLAVHELHVRNPRQGAQGHVFRHEVTNGLGSRDFTDFQPPLLPDHLDSKMVRRHLAALAQAAPPIEEI